MPGPACPGSSALSLFSHSSRRHSTDAWSHLPGKHGFLFLLARRNFLKEAARGLAGPRTLNQLDDHLAEALYRRPHLVLIEVQRLQRRKQLDDARARRAPSQ